MAANRNNTDRSALHGRTGQTGGLPGNAKKQNRQPGTAKPYALHFPDGTHWKKIILPAAIAVITFICFSFSVKSDFVHWDDQVYVYNNPFIRSLSAHNLQMLLFHVTTAGNFHPLTMLSLAVNYHFSGLSPEGYHVTNIILHILNTVILFFVVVRLFESMKQAGYGDFSNKLWLAGLVALWHGIHPMHVESVSWISERKDLLYALFYYLGIGVYLKYLEQRSAKTYSLLIILFLLSSLSKPSAVVFPLTLFAIDFLLKRQFSLKTVSEKIPFFLVSLLLGSYTYSLQSTQGAMSASFDTFTLTQRCFFASYTFMMYVIKAIAPFHLSSFYPYPKSSPSGMLPAVYLLSPIADAVIVGLPLYIAFRAGENYKRLVAAGLLFYFFNVVLILKFVTVGGSLINDRYSYVAYTGLFLIAVFVINELYRKFEKLRYLVIGSVSLYTLLLCITCYSRTRVWYNTQTLWEDVKNKFPMAIEDPYSELADYYRTQGSVNSACYDSALANYEILKNFWRPKDAGVYCNMANIYALKKDYPKAFEAYSGAIRYEPSDTEAYLNRALTYISMNQYKLAIPDLDKALMLDSNLLQALQNRAYANYVAGNYSQALPDYLKLVHLDRDRAGEYLYSISVLYGVLKNNTAALDYALKAQQAGYTLPAGYLQSLNKP